MVRLNFVPNADTEVYSIDGHLIGLVVDAHAAEYSSSRSLGRLVGETGAGYFVMEPIGMKGVGALYVPMDAMSDYTDERIRLRFPKKQLKAQGWDKPPTDQARSQRM